MGQKDCIYRVSVKALIYKGDSLLLISEGEKGWELPGGSLDKGETPHECLCREIREETGLEVTAISETPTIVWSEEWNDEYSLLFLGYRVEVKEGEVTPSEECLDARFLEIPKMGEIKLHNNIKQLPQLLS